MADILNTQAKRLYDSISVAAGSKKAVEIIEKLPLSKTPTEKKKYEWACESCQMLNENFNEDMVKKIRKNCHCKPSPVSVRQMKQMWEDSKNLTEFASQATKAAQGGYTMEPDGDALIMCYPCCYCPMLKHSNGIVPASWCYCSVGYAEDMFSKVTGHEVHAQLLESVVTGGKTCRIKVTFE